MTDTQYEHYGGPDDVQVDNTAYAVVGDNWKAQTFTPSISHTLTSVKLKLYRVDTPGNITVHIRNTTGGVPSGADISTGTTNADTLTNVSPGEWREIIMSQVSLSASVTYAIAVSSDDAVDYLNWRAKWTTPYAGGNLCQSSDIGVTWLGDTGKDFVFAEYGILDNQNMIITGDMTWA